MDKAQILLWATTFLSIVGTILNIKKRKVCFLVWLITNAVWCVYDLSLRNYPQAVLFFVYTLLALWGLVEWHFSARRES